MSDGINKSEFISNLNERCDYLSESQVEEAVNEVLGMMKETLAHDGRVEVRGFGSFSLNHRKPRTARNPKTGDQVEVGAKAIPHFKPGKALRESVNEYAFAERNG